MPIIFQKGSTQHPSHTLMVGSGISLSQTSEGLPEISASTIDALIQPSGGDDTSAIQSAMWSSSRVRLAAGAFQVTAIIDVPAGIMVTGSGADKTTINKTNYSGPVFRLGDTTEHVTIENLRIVGPGRGVTAGNTGIMASRSGAGLAVSRRLRFVNLHIEELSDYGMFLEKCGVVVVENCVLRRCGFNGIWYTGSSLTPRNSYALSLIGVRAEACSGPGINVRYTEGAAIVGCEVEACAGSYKINTVNDAVIAGCVSRKCTGVPLLVSAGSNVVVEAFSSDNVGAASFVDQPHVRIDGSALGVQINGFRRVNTDQPGTLTWEADVSAAGGRVLVGYHDFTAGKINSAGNFAELDATALP